MKRTWVLLMLAGLLAASIQGQPIDAVSSASYVPPPIPRDSADAKEAIREWIADHWLMNIATTEADGSPNISGAVYESDDFTIFFVTRKTSNKYKNIQREPRVAVSIWEPVENMRMLKVVEIIGKAEVVEGPERDVRSRAFDGYPFPEDHAVIRIEPLVAQWTDRSHQPNYSRVVDFRQGPALPQ